MTFPPFIYKEQNNKIIKGQFFKAIVKYNDQYIYELLRVYADKTIAGNYLLNNLPEERLYKHFVKFFPNMDKKNATDMGWSSSDEKLNAISFGDLKYLVRNNFVTLNYKGLIKIEFSNGLPVIDFSFIEGVEIDVNIDNDDFLKSIEDVFCELNNKPTTFGKLMNALCEFLLSSKEDKEIYRKKVHEAYLDIPEYQKTDVYPPTIDTKGKTPIEDILYRKEGRLENYDDFVKMYDDIYFAVKYKRENIKNLKRK